MAGNMNTLDAIQMLVDDAAAFNYTVTRGYEVVDIIATTNATAGGAATVTPSKAGTAIGAAMTVTTTALIVYCTTLGETVASDATFLVGEVLRMTGDRADMDATVTTYVIPTSWIAG